MFKIKLTKSADKDLFFIKSYTGVYGNIVIKKIFFSIGLLTFFPKLGFERKDSLRELIEPKYKY